ncbi:hypothetical protein [Helicobacter fennelliae]|nr:hypothetical protein [Helicobacter fennelliae]
MSCFEFYELRMSNVRKSIHKFIHNRILEFATSLSQKSVFLR